MKANPKATRGARIFLPGLLVLAAGLSACGGGDGPSGVLSEAPTPITVQLSWTHQSQFAGFYAADQNGYYSNEGLEVSFVEGGPGIDRIAPIVEGSAQFGVMGGKPFLTAHADGQPVTAIGTVYRRPA